MKLTELRPYITRQGCLVETSIIDLPNGSTHHLVTLSTPASIGLRRLARVSAAAATAPTLAGSSGDRRRLE